MTEDPAACAECSHPEEDHEGLFRGDPHAGTEDFYPHGCTGSAFCECDEYVPLPLTYDTP